MVTTGCAIAMAACTGGSGTTGDPSDPGSLPTPGGMPVELDIFSGRPNPEWSLSSADGAQFRELLRRTPVIAPEPVLNNLGYRGFVVTVPGLGTARVQNGFVQVTAADDVTYRADQDRAIERWLLDSARQQIEESLYDYVARQIPG